MNRCCSDCDKEFSDGELYAFCTARRADGRRCEAMLCLECQDHNQLMLDVLCCWAHIREIAGIETDQDCD